MTLDLRADWVWDTNTDLYFRSTQGDQTEDILFKNTQNTLISCSYRKNKMAETKANKSLVILKPGHA